MFGESLGTNLGEKGMHHALVSHKTSNEGSTMDCMVLLSNKTSNEGSTMDCMVLLPPSLLQGEPLNKTSNEAGYIRLDSALWFTLKSKTLVETYTPKTFKMNKIKG